MRKLVITSAIVCTPIVADAAVIEWQLQNIGTTTTETYSEFVFGGDLVSTSVTEVGSNSIGSFTGFYPVQFGVETDNLPIELKNAELTYQTGGFFSSTITDLSTGNTFENSNTNTTLPQWITNLGSAGSSTFASFTFDAAGKISSFSYFGTSDPEVITASPNRLDFFNTSGNYFDQSRDPNLTEGVDFSVSYQGTFGMVQVAGPVQAVPLPASGWMLILSLTGLLGYQRRQT